MQVNTTVFHVIELVYNLYMAWLLVATLRTTRRMVQHPVTALGLAAGWGVLAVLPVIVLAPLVGGFGTIRLAAWACFLHCPMMLAVVAWRYWPRSKTVAVIAAAAFIALVAVAIDAFFIEPHWLEVTHTTIATAKLAAPLRIAVVADTQVVAPGTYERRVCEALVREHPDLILFAGDYVQFDSPAAYKAAAADFNTILREENVRAPLGVFAAQGSVDPRGAWTQIFARLPIVVCATRTNFDLGSVVLTVLGKYESTDAQLLVPGSDKFHIVLGHVPSFACGDVRADLLVAGHTHGGQVRLPLLGPAFTLSAIPRAWGAGMTALPGNRTLYVSRGIGMERRNAPRLRFRCRPELAIIDLVPARTARGD